MKRKITTLVVSFFIPIIYVCGQTIHYVTSDADSGAGTLREIIMETAVSGDSIVIGEEITEIVLESEILLTTSKHLKIEGQGVTIKVADPGVSPYRIFGFSFGGERDIYLYNLTLEGGDISGFSSDADRNGGVIFIKRVNLYMQNCILSSGKAYRGGGLAEDASNSLSIVLENCILRNNASTDQNGACYLNAKNRITLKACIFENNENLGSSGCSGINISMPAEITGCTFRTNKAAGGRSGAAVSVSGLAADQKVLIENCLFEGNINAGTDGGPAVVKQGQNGLLEIVNSTFYKNEGGRGAVYLYQGEIILVNNTFAGNKYSGSSNNYGGALYSSSESGITATLINNIFAYNYANDRAHDVYLTSALALSGSNNLITSGNGIATLSNPVSFSYNAENAEEDTPLFASYIPNADGKNIPVLEEETGTIPLLKDVSVAIAAGIVSYDANPSILIPTTDQRGEERNAIPCIGSYEYKEEVPTGWKEITENKLTYWSADGILNIVSGSIQKADLYSIDGRLIDRIMLKEGVNTIFGLNKGFYILNTTKIIVR